MTNAAIQKARVVCVCVCLCPCLCPCPCPVMACRPVQGVYLPLSQMGWSQAPPVTQIKK